MRNQQNVKVRVNSNFETICPFPVGYVYMSSNSTSPGSIYGGTWASISGGRYMRAAAAWGNGGSNTITTNNMPSHRHVMGGGRAHGFYWGDSDLNISTDATVFAGAPSGNKLGTKQQAWAATDYIGGGQHSTQLTRTFGRGTELPSPREGDASCVTFNKFKSVLRAASRKFAHSQLVTFICQPMVQVQQALMEARGRLSQTANSCGQVVHGTLQAASQRTNSLRQKCHHTGTLFTQVVQYPMVMLINIGVAITEQHVLPLLRGILSLTGMNRVYVSLPEAEKLTTIFRHIAPVTLGTAQLSLVGEC